MSTRPVVCLSEPAWAEMCVEATLRAPLETGGVLMGRWTTGRPTVTSVIGPGPAALHRPHAFRPDYEFQEEEIARRFTTSNGHETYLGDWHTHPGATRAALSRQDRRTIARIAEDPASQTTRPLMIVLLGGPDRWSSASWIGGKGRILPGLLGGTALRVDTRIHPAPAALTGRNLVEPLQHMVAALPQ